MHTYIHAHRQFLSHPPTYQLMYVCIYIYIHTHIYTYIHIYIYMYVHTHIHTNQDLHAHTCSSAHVTEETASFTPHIKLVKSLSIAKRQSCKQPFEVSKRKPFEFELSKRQPLHTGFLPGSFCSCIHAPMAVIHTFTSHISMPARPCTSFCT